MLVGIIAHAHSRAYLVPSDRGAYARTLLGVPTVSHFSSHSSHGPVLRHAAMRPTTLTLGRARGAVIHPGMEPQIELVLP
jgi:hypothetical protein